MFFLNKPLKHKVSPWVCSCVEWGETWPGFLPAERSRKTTCSPRFIAHELRGEGLGGRPDLLAPTGAASTSPRAGKPEVRWKTSNVTEVST